MASVFDEITKAAKADPFGAADDLARRLMASVRKDDLLPLLVREIAHAQRHQNRWAERSAFSERFAASVSALPETSEIAAASLDDFKALYETPFKLGDGTSVTWGAATVEQHEIRLSMLRAIRAGLDRTIARHEEAVAILRSSGAPCLEQIRVAS